MKREALQTSLQSHSETCPSKVELTSALGRGRGFVLDFLAVQVCELRRVDGIDQSEAHFCKATIATAFNPYK
jgi:hypothetical protein